MENKNIKERCSSNDNREVDDDFDLNIQVIDNDDKTVLIFKAPKNIDKEYDYNIDEECIEIIYLENMKGTQPPRIQRLNDRNRQFLYRKRKRLLKSAIELDECGDHVVLFMVNNKTGEIRNFTSSSLIKYVLPDIKLIKEGTTKLSKKIKKN